MQLAADGSAEVEGEEVVDRRRCRGATATTIKRPARALSASSAASGALYPGLKLETQHFDALDKLQQPVRYSYRIQVPQLAHWNGDELQVEPSVLHDLVQDMARLQQRRHPLDLQGNRVYVEERSVRVPNGMRATDLPAGGEAISPFGRLKLDVTQGGATITARTELRIDSDHIAQGRLPGVSQLGRSRRPAAQTAHRPAQRPRVSSAVTASDSHGAATRSAALVRTLACAMIGTGAFLRAARVRVPRVVPVRRAPLRAQRAQLPRASTADQNDHPPLGKLLIARSIQTVRRQPDRLARARARARLLDRAARRPRGNAPVS